MQGRQAKIHSRGEKIMLKMWRKYLETNHCGSIKWRSIKEGCLGQCLNILKWK